MDLEELQKKIYKPGAEFEKRPEAPKVFQPNREKEKRSAEEWQIQEKKMPSKKKKKIAIWGLLFTIIFLSAAGWLIWRGLNSFSSSGVSLIVNGPERTISGDEVIYTAVFKNGTNLELTDLKLIVYYPEGSISTNSENLIQSFDLPDLQAEQENKLKIPVRIIGLKNESRKIRVELNYQPVTITSRFVSIAEFSTTIISVPLVLNFDLPEKLVSGQLFDFSLNYLNQADIDFNDTQVEIKYPDGFVFESSSLEPIQENNIWSLGYLASEQQGKILIQGTIIGEPGDIEEFSAKLGFLKDGKFITYAETDNSLNIVSSPLFVSQKVNDSFNPVASVGQRLYYVITYKNTTDVGIKNAVVVSKLEGKALDMSSIKLNKGSFDGSSGNIIWNAGNFSDLSYIAPQEEGEITFSVKLKDNLPISSLSDKNFTVVNTVNINSSQVPLSLKEIEIGGQSRIETKISSQMLFMSSGYYYDDTFSNSGPVPPRVGQTTTYTLKWQIVNAGNDLENVKISAFLPPHVKWLNKISPVASGLEYEQDTGSLIWNVGSVPASTGVLLPVKQISFQVAITPGEAHLYSLVELMGQSNIVGKDSFTGIELTNSRDSIDTDLPSDSKIKMGDGVVEQ
ncbi:hypothetical protein ACFLZ0_02240 [Patescibacteria group bacterium]